MIDFWETVGRMALDPTSAYVTNLAAAGIPAASAIRFGCIDLTAYYTPVRTVTGTWNKAPVSLAALGELMLTLSSAAQQGNVKNVAADIARVKATVPNFPRDIWGVVALGALVADYQLYLNLIGGAGPAYAQFDANGFGLVQAGDRADLNTIWPAIKTDALAFSNTWGDACCDRYEPYPGCLHPVVRAVVPS
jgi:hypothetical protein